ncbi:MAG: thiol-disulfide isomerase/thioredoxin [Alphaproteobacteria bacterium]
MKHLHNLIFSTLFYCIGAGTAQAQVMSFYEKPIQAPNVTWQNMTGDTISMADFKGKVVLLNLWATWCTPCIVEMPAFNFLQKRYAAGGFEVVAVAINDSAEAIVPYLKKHKLNYITGYTDAHENVGKAFRPKSTPTTYLINRKGEVIAGKEGLSDWLSPEMMDLIESELKKNQGSISPHGQFDIIDRNDVHGGIHR